MCKNLLATVCALLRDEEALTSVEYAIVLALIIVVCLASIAALGSNASLGDNANHTFSYVGNKASRTAS